MKPYLICPQKPELAYQVAVIGTDEAQATALAVVKYRLKGKVVAQELTWGEYETIKKGQDKYV
jgi:hypothetical protein